MYRGTREVCHEVVFDGPEETRGGGVRGCAGCGGARGARRLRPRAGAGAPREGRGRVYVGETGATVAMARPFGRAPRRAGRASGCATRGKSKGSGVNAIRRSRKPLP